MLEGLISKILGPLLDKYLVDFDRSQLSLSIASGNVFVQQLLLKSTALQDIHPGLNISYGILDNVKVSFSLLRLGSVPIQVEISNMALLVTSKDDIHIDQDKLEQWLNEKLIGKIQGLFASQELFAEQMKLQDSDISQSKFVKKLIAKIVNNLIVKINRVHVRVELPQENSAVGIALGQLVIHSVNDKNEEIIVKETDGLLRKRVMLRDLSVYCSPMINQISKLPQQRQKMFLLQTIATKDNWRDTNFQYIIQPMYLDLMFIWNRDENRDKNTPQFDIKLTVDNFNINLTMLQINTLLTIVSCLQFGLDVHRPELLPKEETPTQIMNYMLQNITYNDVMVESMKISQNYEIKRYMELFAQHYINYETNEYNSIVKADNDAYAKNKISPKYMFTGDCSCLLDKESDQQEMALLQEVLSLEQINRCRQIVIFYLKDKNLKNLKKQQAYWNLNNEQIQEAEKKLDEYLNKKEQHTQEQLNQQFLSASVLFDALTLNLDQTNVKQVVRQTDEMVRFKQMKIPALTGIISEIQPMLQLKLSSIQMGFNMKLNNEIGLQLSVDELSTVYTHDAQFKKIIQKVPQNRNDIIKCIQNEYKSKDEIKQLNISLKFGPEKKLQLHLDIEPIAIVVSSTIIDIVQILQKEIEIYNQYQTQEVTDLIQVTDDRWDNFKSFGNAAVKQATENHITLDIELFISAPKIIIPYQNFKKEYQYFMVNLGDLVIKTQSDIQNEVKVSQELYDYFSIVMSNIFIINGGTQKQIEYDLSLLQQRKMTQSLLLKPAQIQVDIAMCYVVNYYDVDRMLINLLLTKLQLQLNKYQIDNFIILALYLKQLLFPLLQQALEKDQDDDVTDEEGNKLQLSPFEKQLLRLVNDSLTLSGTSMNASSSLSLYSSLNKSKSDIAKYVLMKCNVQLDGLLIDIGYIHTIIAMDLGQIKVNLLQQPYNTNIQADINSLQILDFDNNIILGSQQGNKLLQVNIIQQKKQHPQFQNCECKIQILLDQLTLQIHSQSITNSVNEVILLLAETNATIQQTVIESALELKKYQTKQQQQQKKLEQKQEYPYEKLFNGLVQCLRQRKDERPVITLQNLCVEVVINPIVIQMFNFEEQRLFQLILGQENVRFIQAQEAMQINYQLLDIQLLTSINKNEYKLLRTLDNTLPLIAADVSMNNPKSFAFNGYLIQCDVSNQNQIMLQIDTRELFSIVKFTLQFINVCKSKIDYKKVQAIMNQYVEALSDKDENKQIEEIHEEKKQSKIIPTLLINIDYKLPIVNVPFGNQIQKDIYLDLGQIKVSNQYTDITDDEIFMRANLIYEGLKFSVLNSQGQSIYDGIQNVGFNIIAELPIQQRIDQCKLIKAQIQSQQEIQIEVSMQLKLLLIEMLQPASNLGYRLIDDENYTENDVNKLREELKEIKLKSQQTEEESTQSQVSVQNQQNQQMQLQIQADVNFSGIKIVIDNPKDRNQKYLTKISDLQVQCNVNLEEEIQIKQCNVKLQKVCFQDEKTEYLTLNNFGIGINGDLKNLNGQINIDQIYLFLNVESFLPLYDYVPQIDPQDKKIMEIREQKRIYRNQCQILQQKIDEYKQGKKDLHSLFNDQLQIANTLQKINMKVQLQQLCLIAIIFEKGKDITQFYLNSQVQVDLGLQMQNRQVKNQSRRGMQEYEQKNDIDVGLVLTISEIGLNQNGTQQHLINDCKIGADVKLNSKQYLLIKEQSSVIVSEQQITVTPQLENFNIKLYDTQIYQFIISFSYLQQKYQNSPIIKDVMEKIQSSNNQKVDFDDDDDEQILLKIPDNLKNILEPGCIAQGKTILNGKKYLQVNNKFNIQIMLNIYNYISFCIYIKSNPLISFEIQRITTQLNMNQIQQKNQPQMQINALLTMALKGYIAPYSMEMYLLKPTEIFASLTNIVGQTKEQDELIGQVQIQNGLNLNVSIDFIKTVLDVYTQRLYSVIFLIQYFLNKTNNSDLPQLQHFNLVQNENDFKRNIIMNHTKNKIIIITQTEQIEIGSYQQIYRNELQLNNMTINIYDAETGDFILGDKKDLQNNCIQILGKKENNLLIRHLVEDQTNKVIIYPPTQIINQCMSKVTILCNNQRIQIKPDEQVYIESYKQEDKLYLLDQDQQKKLEIKQGSSNQQYQILIEYIKDQQTIFIKPSKIFINQSFYVMKIDEIFINQLQAIDSTQLDFTKEHKVQYLNNNVQFQALINFSKIQKSQYIKFTQQDKHFELCLKVQQSQVTQYTIYEQIGFINMFNSQTKDELKVIEKQQNYKLGGQQLYIQNNLTKNLTINDKQLNEIKDIKNQLIQNDEYQICLIPQIQQTGCCLYKLIEPVVIQNLVDQDFNIRIFNEQKTKSQQIQCQKKQSKYLVNKFTYLTFDQEKQENMINIQKLQGEVQIKLKDQFIKLYIQKVQLQTIICILSVSNESIYQIINRTGKLIQFQQKGQKNKQQCHSSMIGQIDFNYEYENIITVQYKNQTFNINLSKLGRRKPLNVGNQMLYIEVIYENNITQAIINDKLPQTYTVNKSTLLSVDQCKTKINLNIQQINVSLFNQNNSLENQTERLRITLDNIIANVIQNNETLQIQASINDFMIIDTNNKTNNNFILQCHKFNNKFLNSVIQLNTKKNSIQQIAIFMENKLYLNIHQSNLDSILEIVQSILPIPSICISYQNYDQQNINIGLLFKVDENKYSEHKHIVIDNFYISNIGIQCFVKIANVNGISASITYLTQAIGWLATLNNVNIQFSPLKLSGYHGADLKPLIDQLVCQYVHDVATQAPQILGGLSFVGTITSSATQFVQGINDTKDNPKEGLQGIQNSYLSLFSNTLSSITQITSSLTFDENYIKQRNISYEESQTSAKSAATNAAKAVGYGFYEGFTDIVRQPIQLGREEGATGVFKGIGKGIASIITKPVSGILDGASHLLIAGQSKTKSNDIKQEIVYLIQ